MYTHHTITNQRFTVRLCKIAQYYSFKKVGSLRNFLIKHKSEVRIVWGFGRTESIQKLLDEIEEYRKTCE